MTHDSHDNIDVSIIVVSYNTATLLQNCLDSILRHTKDVRYEVIVVDNASTDGSPEMVARMFPDVALLRNQVNVGFAKANNLGYQQATGKYLFFLNSDTALLDNAVQTFASFLDTPGARDVFACGGALISEKGAPMDSCGNLPSLLEMFVFLFRLDTLAPRRFMERISSSQAARGPGPYQMAKICGADLFLRRRCLGEETPFNSDFFMYFEESELCWRMNRRGYHAMVLPQVRIVHLGGRSSSSASLTRAELYEHAKLLYFLRCHGGVSVAILRCLHITAYVLRYVLRRNRSDLRKLQIHCAPITQAWTVKRIA